MNASTSIKTVLLITFASVFATGVELAGVDSLAAPRDPGARQAVVQLPTVVSNAQREARSVATVQHLPRRVIVAHRDALTATTKVARTVAEI